MKHVQNYSDFVNEAQVERYNKDNTFYWSSLDSKLFYQIPYIFPGQSEEVTEVSYDLEGADRRKLYDIVKKANDAMNKETEAFQKTIAKIGEDAAKEFNKVAEAAAKK